MRCIQDCERAYNHGTIKRVTSNVLRRARLCFQAGGGHFQQLLQYDEWQELYLVVISKFLGDKNKASLIYFHKIPGFTPSVPHKIKFEISHKLQIEEGLNHI